MISKRFLYFFLLIQCTLCTSCSVWLTNQKFKNQRIAHPKLANQYLDSLDKNNTLELTKIKYVNFNEDRVDQILFVFNEVGILNQEYLKTLFDSSKYIVESQWSYGEHIYSIYGLANSEGNVIYDPILSHSFREHSKYPNISRGSQHFKLNYKLVSFLGTLYNTQISVDLYDNKGSTKDDFYKPCKIAFINTGNGQTTSYLVFGDVEFTYKIDYFDRVSSECESGNEQCARVIIISKVSIANGTVSFPVSGATIELPFNSQTGLDDEYKICIISGGIGAFKGDYYK